MSSYPYAAQYRQGAPSNAPQLAQQQRQQQRTQHSAPSSAAYYPSPESTSSSSDGSSPAQFQPSPVHYKSAPSGQHSGQLKQPPRASQQAPTTPTSPKDASWLCMYPEHRNTFVRKADLKRHYDHVHNATSLRPLDCPESGCHRRGNLAFGRKDKLVEHLREVHKADIPKRVTGERRH